jgi:hypothetical protein
MKHLSIVLAIAAIGCAVQTQPLTPAGQNVKVAKAEPVGNCTELGPITAQSGGGQGMYGAKGTYEDAHNILRNKAGEMGANYVRMDSQVMPVAHLNAFTIYGVAFYCQ